MRDDMDRQEYLTGALSRIDDADVRQETEKELSAHIDDREQYFLDCGYESETAEKMAIERMGSPEAAADGFSKVHKNHRRITAILAVMSLLLSAVIFPIFWLTVVILFDEKSALGTGLGEALFLIYVIGMSLIGKRRNSRFICFTAAVYFIITYAAYFFGTLFGSEKDAVYSVCSHIIFKLSCLLTFDFECLDTFWQVLGVKVAPYIICLSYAFCTVILVLLILTFANVCALKRPTYSLRTKRFTKRVFKAQKSMLIFISLTMLVLPIYNSYDKDKGMTVKTPENVSHIVIAQSDTPCPVSEIPTEDILIIGLDEPFGVEILSQNNNSPNNSTAQNIYVADTYFSDGFSGKYTVSGKYITKECGNKLKYSVLKTDIPCYVTKDYVYIEFFNELNNNETVSYDTVYKFVSDNSGCWYKTESAGEITAAVDASGQVGITFNKSA